jgi:hypothetical protein
MLPQMLATFAAVAAVGLQAEPDQFAGCSAMAGTFEGFTTRIAVHQEHVYMAQANSVSHSSGKIIASTDCSCSGLINFAPGKETFNWQYNFWTCELKWTKSPTLENPQVEEVNIWEKDGDCMRPAVCNPEQTVDGLRFVTMAIAEESANKTRAAAEAVVQYGGEIKAAAEKLSVAAPTDIRVKQAVVEITKALRLADEAFTSISSALSIPRNGSNVTVPPPPTALLGLPKAGNVVPPTKRRVLKRRAGLVQQHTKRLREEPPTELATGCAGMAGDYENGASIIDVHPEGVFVASSQGTPAAQGEVSKDTMCKCSGDMMFGELGRFQFHYDAHTCALTWLTMPTLQAPVSAITNVWKRDSNCLTRVVCDPEVIRAKLLLPKVPPLAADIALASILGGLKLARAVNLLAEAAVVIVTQASLLSADGHGSNEITAAAKSVASSLAMGKQASNLIFDGVAIVNAQAARESCRAPLLVTVRAEDFALAHVASLPAA